MDLFFRIVSRSLLWADPMGIKVKSAPVRVNLVKQLFRIQSIPDPKKYGLTRPVMIVIYNQANLHFAKIVPFIRLESTVFPDKNCVLNNFGSWE